MNPDPMLWLLYIGCLLLVVGGVKLIRRGGRRNTYCGVFWIAFAAFAFAPEVPTLLNVFTNP